MAFERHLRSSVIAFVPSCTDAFVDARIPTEAEYRTTWFVVQSALADRRLEMLLRSTLSDIPEAVHSRPLGQELSKNLLGDVIVAHVAFFSVHRVALSVLRGCVVWV